MPSFASEGSPQTPLGFLRLLQILELIPMSKSAWWAGVKSGQFPQPVKLGPHTTAWHKADVFALIDEISAQSRPKRPAAAL